MLGLRVVKEEALGVSPAELLILGGTGITRITVEERDIPLPLVSLLLRDYYTLGDLVDGGERYGLQMTATLSYIWQGKKRPLTGIAVPLLRGPLLAVPFGFLAGPH